ncbi:RHS repeat-associated core domain-containing protein [Aquiflexum balticum DSM 16537]|uniref:RHS repeat-associated core domain-containing protein n=1 Tax=Aquiflexum balticum DSM 16537 TaxID=758820 RepID=A0A1W2HAK8_9BACT|nr:M91 family zinc metallopeptidase [Aquiflexum balticum]SMD45748.1 RHS repeat-associated core domain-containing protein [Aquiflexum balticum DSM 16537]
MYDPAIGRFNRIDRFSEKYYGLSPYQYGANNPIKYIDINGDSIVVNTQFAIPTIFGGVNANISLHYNNGTFNFQNGAEYSGPDQFVNNVKSGLNELEKSNAGNEMINTLISSTEKMSISDSESNGYSPSKKEVSWNTESKSLIPTEMGLQNPKSFISLGHELAHAEDHVKGTLNTSRTWTSNKYPQAEKYATHRENQIRGELGLPLRTHYGLQRLSSGSLIPDKQSQIIKNGFSNFYQMKVGPIYLPYVY